MSQRQIFKVAILSHDEYLFERLFSVFGVDFEKAMTQTSGAAFSYSHFNYEGERLTAQFWLLDGSPQWASIRNLYLKGVSGIIMLYDPGVKHSREINKRLLKEFVTVNRFPVPVIVMDVSEKNSLNKAQEFANDTARWTGYKIRAITRSDKDVVDVMSQFMGQVKQWRARNVIFQTLRLYFSMDSITAERRSISTIIKQLRRIYTARYYDTMTDSDLFKIIQQATIMEGFDYDHDEKSIVYRKRVLNHPWEEFESKIYPDDNDKPKVEKM
ncbi:MAG: hypothetical protein ACXAE3_13780 [Candidatus Kariarchaeaceae archaeon]|jgi:hypothetical protein